MQTISFAESAAEEQSSSWGKPKLYCLHPLMYIRGHTKNVDPEKLIEDLHDRAIRMVVNVSRNRDPLFRCIAEGEGIKYVHEPMSDNDNVEVEKVKRITTEVVKAMRKGSAVMVHCEQGCNRSGLVALLSLIRYTKGDAKKVLYAARVVRPLILYNKHFETFVLRNSKNIWKVDEARINQKYLGPLFVKPERLRY